MVDGVLGLPQLRGAHALEELNRERSLEVVIVQHQSVGARAPLMLTEHQLQELKLNLVDVNLMEQLAPLAAVTATRVVLLVVILRPHLVEVVVVHIQPMTSLELVAVTITAVLISLVDLGHNLSVLLRQPSPQLGSVWIKLFSVNHHCRTHFIFSPS